LWRGLAQPNEPSVGVGFWGPRGRRRAAQGKTDQEVQMSEPAGRVSELPGLTEQRRAVPVLRDRRIRGALLFGYFLLGKQEKVTRLSGRRPDAMHRRTTPSNNTKKNSPHKAGCFNQTQRSALRFGWTRSNRRINSRRDMGFGAVFLTAHVQAVTPLHQHPYRECGKEDETNNDLPHKDGLQR
jgi:hypothetical protein